jgi:hypothetical protein
VPCVLPSLTLLLKSFATYSATTSVSKPSLTPSTCKNSFLRNYFLTFLLSTDPDPIYVCQLLDVCAEVDGGNVTLVSATSSPQNGSQGSTFTVTMTYSVTSPTGPGFLTIVVIPPDTGAPLSAATFVEGQATGEYQISWPLTTTPSEQEPFSNGVYQAYVAVCEGDCTTKHPYGGIYAEGQTKFQIV